MLQRLSPLSTVLAFTILLSTPLDVLARGGGGGGGHFSGGGARFGGGCGGRGYGWGGYRGYGWGGYRGYGWGYRGWGWGYPYYGYGLGLGLGVGLGYGLAGGYYGGYGYGGYGYGYPGYGYYGYGYGYDPYATGNGGTYGPAAYAALTPSPATPSTAAQTDSTTLEAGREFAEKGEAAFKAADYQGAVYALRHAAVDDPRNAVVTLLLGQALFATGQFDEAAGATQSAMQRLPKEKWGVVISHYTELYGNTRDYTSHLRALEQRVKEKPDDPALRFLAGFHYAYLGFTTQAIDQLDKVLSIAPRDAMARQLREELRGRLVRPAVAPVPPAPVISEEPQGPALEQ